MKVLGIGVNDYVTDVADDINEIKITEVNRQSIEEWIDVFCNSFDSLDSKNEVKGIITKHSSKFTLLVAGYKLNQRMHSAGCCLLF
jgi:hypothetical protein